MEQPAETPCEIFNAPFEMEHQHSHQVLADFPTRHEIYFA